MVKYYSTIQHNNITVQYCNTVLQYHNTVLRVILLLRVVTVVWWSWVGWVWSGV